MSSLKYFYENAPQYHIVCVGSLLGITLHKGTSFPVGKVDFLSLYPLSFKEFLTATAGERFAGLLDKQDYQMITSFKQIYIDALKQYYFVGGMPEAVQSFAEEKDFNEIREIQKCILAAYEQDFSRHAPVEIMPKIRMIWNSIPSQLAKENKKFIYGLVREGARAKEYEAAIMWLCDCGLVHKVSRVNATGMPLKAYEELKAFKLFIVDVGLLGCMTGLRQRILLDGNDLFTEFKGALTEQYVCQQHKTIDDLGVYYYTNDRGSCEVDFIIDTGEQIVPVEACVTRSPLEIPRKSLISFGIVICLFATTFTLSINVFVTIKTSHNRESRDFPTNIIFVFLINNDKIIRVCVRKNDIFKREHLSVMAGVFLQEGLFVIL